MSVLTRQERIDLLSFKFKTAFGSLSEDEINLKPSPAVWSIAQITDHLIKINSSYFLVFDEIAAGTYKKPFMGKFPFLVRFFGKMILESVSPDRRKKIKTFPVWEPSRSNITGVLTGFLDSQEILKSKIEQCRTFMDNQTVISSPANRIIVYNLDTAVEIILAHEERHFLQAKELLDIRN